MLVGDFLDAMGGYNEGEVERVKSIAELIRGSTTLLWNLQVDTNSRRTPAELWPLPWDKEVRKIVEIISDEEAIRRQQLQDEFLKTNFPEK